MTKINATRYHDFSCGHRVAGHESKCAYLHGHNYRVTFSVEPTEDDLGNQNLDDIGRVLDFSVIKSLLCEWLEENWDHKFLMWVKDPLLAEMSPALMESIVIVPFNPTAENMGDFLLNVAGPLLLADHGVKLVKVIVEETRKCSAEVSL